MNKAREIWEMRSTHRHQLQRIGWLACLFVLIHTAATKAIGYYIAFQLWSVQEATRSVYETPYDRPALWDGELSAAAWIWGLFLALATIGVGTYVKDKWQNYVRTGSISSTTEPAIKGALHAVVQDYIASLPDNQLFTARMTYDPDRQDHSLVVSRHAGYEPLALTNGRHA